MFKFKSVYGVITETNSCCFCIIVFLKLFFSFSFEGEVVVGTGGAHMILNI